MIITLNHQTIINQEVKIELKQYINQSMNHLNMKVNLNFMTNNNKDSIDKEVKVVSQIEL